MTCACYDLKMSIFVFTDVAVRYTHFFKYVVTESCVNVLSPIVLFAHSFKEKRWNPATPPPDQKNTLCPFSSDLTCSHNLLNTSREGEWKLLSSLSLIQACFAF